MYQYGLEVVICCIGGSGQTLQSASAMTFSLPCRYIYFYVVF